jgi:iron complex transport system substrate-binding protein
MNLIIESTENQIYRRLRLFLSTFLAMIVISGCISRAPLQESSHLHSQPSDCHIVQHDLGETCVPSNPQRVIVLHPLFLLDNLLALDVQPIATAVFLDRPAPLYLEDHAEEIEQVGSVFQPSIEKILQLHPDLILATPLHEDIYLKLSQIAPTVVNDFMPTDWKEYLLDLAKIVNRTEQAQQQIESYEKRILELRQALGKRVNLEVSLIRISGDDVRIYTPSSLPGTILKEIGIKRPPAQTDSIFDDVVTSSISLEKLELADGDVMFIFGEREGAEQTFERLQSHSLWRRLNAVKNDHVYVVPESYWFLPGIQGVNHLIDDLFKYLVDNPELESGCQGII